MKSKTYEIEITQDHSPTLRPDRKESMHHMGGAAGESVYLYYEALSRYFFRYPAPNRLRVLSFGFGMGYNEILTVVFYLKHKRDLSQLDIISHEKDLFLYELFNTWLEDDEGGSIYDKVYQGIAEKFTDGVSPLKDVKTALKELKRQGQWQQMGPVMTVSDLEGSCDVVYYDAYSAKTNDYLWSEDFLTRFFETKLSANFVFSTYACTAVLKRVAANSGSRFEKREGFMGKRNSSLICRFL